MVFIFLTHTYVVFWQILFPKRMGSYLQINHNVMRVFSNLRTSLAILMVFSTDVMLLGIVLGCDSFMKLF